MAKLQEIKKKGVRFLAAGAIASAVDYFLYLFLVEVAGNARRICKCYFVSDFCAGQFFHAEALCLRAKTI